VHPYAVPWLEPGHALELALLDALDGRAHVGWWCRRKSSRRRVSGR
jgi:hypothetical protein